VIESHSTSVRKACKLLGTFPSVFCYNHKKQSDELVEGQLQNLANCHSSWGFWKMYHRIRNQGLSINHKKVYRIYTQMKLNMRRKYKKRLPARIKQGLAQPLHHNYTWSMDFMHDGLDNGKSFRAFNVIDDFNREILNITIDTSLTSERVVRELKQLVEWRGIGKLV
jgi:putative transposase